MDATSATLGSLSGRTARGAAWLALSRLLARLIDFATLTLLARALSPADFGLVGIAMSFVMAIEMATEIPISSALIRSQTLNDDHLATALTLSIGRGLFIFVLLLFAAQPISVLYNDPRLMAIIVVLALAPLVRSPLSPRMVYFARAMSFTRDLVIELSSKSLAFTLAVSVAFTTHSYWAIVAGTVATPIAATLISYLLAPWKPRFSLKAWPEFVSFLRGMGVSQILTALSFQSDRIVMSRLLPQSQFGQFALAGDIAQLPVRVILAPASNPLLSAFSLVRHNRERLIKSYLRTIATLFSLCLPVLVGLSLVAEHAVPLLIGPQWDEAGWIVRWLALITIPGLYAVPLTPLAIALDRSDLFIRRSVIEVSVKIPVLIAAGYFYGIAGALVALLVVAMTWMMVSVVSARQILGVRLRDQIMAPSRAFAAAFIMLGVVLIARTVTTHMTSSYLALTLEIASGGAAYLIGVMALWAAFGKPDGPEALALSQAKRLLRRGA